MVVFEVGLCCGWVGDSLLSGMILDSSLRAAILSFLVLS